MQDKSSRRGYAIFWDLWRWKVKFWSSSMRLNFVKILFPGTSNCCGCHGLGLESAYALFRGRNPEQRFAHFLKKVKKWEKSDFRSNLIKIWRLSWKTNRIQIINCSKWLVEQDVSSSARRVIRLQEKSLRRGYATFLWYLHWKLKFESSSMRLNLVKILFSKTSESFGVMS